MAIPSWFADDGWARATDRHSVEELERTADAVTALAHTTRLEILTVLAREGPATYSDLKAAITVADNGQFNYHLRQLDGFVVERDGTYALTDAGERVRELVLEDGFVADLSDG